MPLDPLTAALIAVQENAETLKGEPGKPGKPGGPGKAGDPGLDWRGPWSTSDSYAPGDAVELDGSSYVAVQPSKNQRPPSGVWDLLALKGAPGPPGRRGGGGGNAGGAGVSDHGALTGLADDDHPQYLTQAEGDAAYDALGASAARAPADATYLVGAAHAGLSAEIVVGATPGGELGGTWASPTVDATHSGSTHAAAQAAAESTAAGALSSHAGAADPHTGYRLESADHSHATTGLQGGVLGGYIPQGGPLTEDLDTDGNNIFMSGGAIAGVGGNVIIQPDLPGVGDITLFSAAGDVVISASAGIIEVNTRITNLADPTDPQDAATKASSDAAAAAAASASIAKAFLDAKGDLISASADNTPAKLTVGANDTILMADSAQTAGLKWVASQTPTTQAFSDAAAQGTADTYARGDHLHGMPPSPAATVTWVSIARWGL